MDVRFGCLKEHVKMYSFDIILRLLGVVHGWRPCPLQHCFLAMTNGNLKDHLMSLYPIKLHRIRLCGNLISIASYVAEGSNCNDATYLKLEWPSSILPPPPLPLSLSSLLPLFSSLSSSSLLTLLFFLPLSGPPMKASHVPQRVSA